jgi:hypothetical protein
MVPWISLQIFLVMYVDGRTKYDINFFSSSEYAFDTYDWLYYVYGTLDFLQIFFVMYIDGLKWSKYDIRCYPRLQNYSLFSCLQIGILAAKMAPNMRFNIDLRYRYEP